VLSPADGEPVDEGRVFSAAEIARGGVLVLRLHRLTSSPSEDQPPHFGLVGESDGIGRLRREIRRLAPLDVAVLLCGETGTGKELVARGLHAGGPRRQGPYLAGGRRLPRALRRHVDAMVDALQVSKPALRRRMCQLGFE